MITARSSRTRLWNSGISFGMRLMPRQEMCRQLASPMRLSRTPTRRDRAGPLPGEHTEEIVRELGRSEAELKQLAKVGVIRIAKALQRAGKVRKGAER